LDVRWECRPIARGIVTVVALSLREYADVHDLPEAEWDQLVRDCRASIFFDTHLLAGIYQHSVEAPLAIRYFAVMERDALAGVAVAYAIRRSVWWRYYEGLIDCPDLFRGPWIAMPSVLTWNGDSPLRAGSDAAEAAALLVAAGRRFAAEQRAVAVAATNVTRGAPLTAPLAALADLAILLDNNAVISGPTSFEAYLASLEPFVKRELMRVRRRAAERGCQWRWYRPAEYPPWILGQLLVLANGGAVRHDHEPEYSLELLTALATVPSAHVLLAVADGAPVAGFLVHEDARTLYVHAGGWDARRKELSPFVNIVHEVVRKAYEWNKQAIEFGRTNYRFKRKHGCGFVPLYGLFYLTELADPGLRDRILTVDRGVRALIDTEGGDTAALPP
jgi:predicted N-acyltransferase